MPNNIPAQQNLAEFIDLLRASRQIYSDAKRNGMAQLVLSLSSAVGGPLLSAVFPAVKAWAGLYAVGALLIDLIFLEPAAKKKQETGARVQELFDTRLYGMPWNRVKVGPPPDPETLAEMATKSKHKHPDDKLLQDWYPAAVGAIPIEYARLICQRSNMRWDWALRRNFCVIYLILLIVVWLAGAGYALAAGYNMEGFVLSVVVPLLPAAVQIWREYKKHEESAKDSERAKEYLEGLWDRAMKENLPPEELLHQARLLQDEVYDRRRRAPTVPEILYARKREEYEEQMKQAGVAKVKEVQTKLSAAVAI